MLANPFDEFDEGTRPWRSVVDALRWAVQSRYRLTAHDSGHVSIGAAGGRGINQRHHRRARIIATIKALEEQEQRLVVAHAEGLTAKQIAKALGIGSPATARRRVAAAHDKLLPRLVELGVVERPNVDEHRLVD